MKKIRMFVSAVILSCAMAVTAMAATVTTTVDKKVIAAGEDVTVTVVLDETVEGTVFEGAVNYNKELYTYKDAELSDEYKDFNVTNSTRKSSVLFDKIDLNATELTFPAGTIIRITFTAKDDIAENHAESAFTLKCNVANAKNEVKNITIENKADVIIAVSHTWGEGVVTKEATCKETGEMTYTCTCGETKVETIPATGEHVYDEGFVTKEATCSTSGEMTYTCTCGETKVKAIPATGEHVYGEGVVTKEATCTEAGTKVYTCTVCEETKTEAIAVNPENHVYGEGVMTKEATCKEAGEKTYTCACGKVKVETISKTSSHTWDDGKVTTEAGCENDGVKIYTCTVCEETKTEAIEATGHVWDEGTVTAPAGCETKGEKAYTCAVCGETKTEVLEETGHTWDEGKVVKEATETEEGKMEYTCTECKLQKYEILPKKDSSDTEKDDTASGTQTDDKSNTQTGNTSGTQTGNASGTQTGNASADSNNTVTKSPATGDSNSAYLWILLLAAAVGIGGVSVYGMRRKNR